MTAAKIRNVGPKSAAWLRQVGVRSLEDLERVGALEAFLKVKRAGFRPSLNLLYSMAGALADCHWADLPDERKQALQDELAAAESEHPILTRWQKAAAASERPPTPTADGSRDQATDDMDAGHGEASSESDGGGGDDGLSRFG
jgi:hypothetical protein